jgi:hypothetical protein
MNRSKHVFARAAMAVAAALAMGSAFAVAPTEAYPDAQSSVTTQPSYPSTYLGVQSSATTESSNPSIHSRTVIANEPAVYAAPAPVYDAPETVYVEPRNDPWFTPETGDAQYGSKASPYGAPAFAPPARFNDATAQ